MKPESRFCSRRGGSRRCGALELFGGKEWWSAGGRKRHGTETDETTKGKLVRAVESAREGDGGGMESCGPLVDGTRPQSVDEAGGY